MMENKNNVRGSGTRGKGEKPQNFKESMMKLVRYAKSDMPLFVIAFICAILGSVLNLLGPGKLSDITDTITAGLMTGIDMEALTQMFIELIIIYVCGAALLYIQGFIMATVTQKLSNRMRKDVSHKINRVPMSFFNKVSYGDVLSRVTNDVDQIGQTLNQSAASLVSAATMFIGSLVIMIFTNIWMAITAVLASLLGFLLLIFIVSKSQRYFRLQQRNLGMMNSHVEEVYSGHNVVKIYNGEKSEKKKFDKINMELSNSAFMAQMMSGMMRPIMIFVGNLAYVLVCIVGAALAMNGKITFGVIVAFMMYVRQFTQPLQQFAQGTTSLQSAAAASERIFEFLEADEMEDERAKTKKLASAKGSVEFEHVRFAYDEAKGDIIHDFSAKVEPGQKIAIVGPTGAGKTTLVNLLMRFFEINGGKISIDGIPVHELTRENVHEMFCMVLQETWIFEGTVRENIVYCKENVTDEQIQRACKAVGLDHFIRTLPKGYDTVLGDEMSLSAGQKQQITIARAMVQDAPMLILDEATSSIDTRTELVIQNAMDTLMKGRTSFVIAHRLSTIKNADLILVLKDGDVIESGNHEELMEKGGFYADLYNSQFVKAS